MFQISPNKRNKVMDKDKYRVCVKQGTRKNYYEIEIESTSEEFTSEKLNELLDSEKGTIENGEIKFDATKLKKLLGSFDRYAERFSTLLASKGRKGKDESSA